MLADIFEDAPIPYVHFRDNAYRQLKNDQSDRKVPISPALIRLGFLDHVRAMRELGHELLFPEFYNPKASMSFDHIFYDKVFEPLRKFHFPNGTSQKRGRKDVDVHSIRTRVASFWRDRKLTCCCRWSLSSATCYRSCRSCRCGCARRNGRSSARSGAGGRSSAYRGRVISACYH